MNKILKALMCAGLCGTMVFAVACNDKTGGNNGDNPDNPTVQKNDPEKLPLVLSLGAVDGNFNPFFYTSQNDGQVVSMTQASLITTEVITDDLGNVLDVIPAAGEAYPTVAKDFTIKYYNPDGAEVPEARSDEAAVKGGRTEYEFLIKNGMKYSDGNPLTVKDVLFNFYVYLDTAYTGSNTMYSVDIQGLAAYYKNDSTLDDDAVIDTQVYELRADARIDKLADYAINNYELTTEEELADFALAKKLYLEQLESDWNSNSTSWSVNYEANYTFTKAWQAFLFQRGEIAIQKHKNADGSSYAIKVDDKGNKIERLDSEGKETEEYKNGKFLTTLDPFDVDCNDTEINDGSEIGAWAIIADIEDATTAEKIKAYRDADSDRKDMTDDAIYDELTKEYCINRLYTSKTESRTSFIEVIYGSSYYTLLNELVAQERAKDIASSTNERNFIKGISTYKTTTWKNENLGESYDVFKIVINKVDPAAIWQFGVSIAPLHYYSDAAHSGNNFNGHLHNGTDDDNEHINFGVDRGNPDFFTNVLKHPDKNGLPIGAGAYKASTINGGTASARRQFENNNWIYYERNTYFTTMGAEMENAKIKNLRYKVLEENSIIGSLATGEIHYGEPTAKPENATEIAKYSHLTSKNYMTNGYGYIGINASKVPDIEVRKTIMGVFQTGDALRYYGNLGSEIYRSMSLSSWAYPSPKPSNYAGLEDYQKRGQDATAIREYLQTKGYEVVGGKLRNKQTSEYLTYTFTIAGATSDHPAYQMFKDAEKLLNAAGFTITVSTDPNALMELTRGGLQVWAAAWSSGVDPDMYQLYHKDSNATSVLNWGYPDIMRDNVKYGKEQDIVNQLSDLIEQGRATNDKDQRRTIYGQCLNLIQGLAVELPLYQRNDLCVYNSTIIDPASLNQKANCYNNLINNIWEVNYL